jgi:hypothetical protein
MEADADEVRRMAPISEEEFLNQVIDLANLHGWRAAHFRPAKTNRGWRTAMQGDKGFPDLVLLKDGKLVVPELKVGRNKTTADQDEWLRRFRECGAIAEVWRPEDWERIKAILEGRA